MTWPQTLLDQVAKSAQVEPCLIFGSGPDVWMLLKMVRKAFWLRVPASELVRRLHFRDPNRFHSGSFALEKVLANTRKSEERIARHETGTVEILDGMHEPRSLATELEGRVNRLIYSV